MDPRFNTIQIGGNSFSSATSCVRAYEDPVELLGTNLDTDLLTCSRETFTSSRERCTRKASFLAPRTEWNRPNQPACTLTLPVAEPAFGRNYRYNDGRSIARTGWKIAHNFMLNLVSAGILRRYSTMPIHVDSNFVMAGSHHFRSDS